MIPAGEFVRALDRHEVLLHTGVPCSTFAAVIDELTRGHRYVPAVNEGAALALAAGVSARGERAAVYAQNSGLGNLINPLTSLLMPYRLPALVFMSLRGWPDPGADEPQHAVMGQSTHALLTALRVRHWTLRRDDTEVEAVLKEALAHTSEGFCAFILLERGTIGGSAAPRPESAAMSRTEALRTVVREVPDALLVATTGHTSRELFALADSPRAFYMQGSMGHASAFALGVEMSGGGDRPVVVLDGDGAALMHLGTMSTIGASRPDRFVHVILDNGSYASTGGQATTSGTTDFAVMGLAAGYRSSTACRTQQELGKSLQEAARRPGPHLITVPVSSRGTPPPRATSAISAPGIADRFRRAAS